MVEISEKSSKPPNTGVFAESKSIDHYDFHKARCKISDETRNHHAETPEEQEHASDSNLVSEAEVDFSLGMEALKGGNFAVGVKALGRGVVGGAKEAGRQVQN